MLDYTLSTEQLAELRAADRRTRAQQGRFKFLAKAAPEGRKSVAVRVKVAGNEAKRQ